MKAFLWFIAAALPLSAQPKLLVNAKPDTRSAAAGLEQTFKPLLAAQPQPAWIAYSVPSSRVNLGCDYVRDSGSQPGVIHLEPPDHAVIFFRVEGGAVERIRTLSPDCEIDAGDLPVHWLSDVVPAESVALLDTFATGRERYMDAAMRAVAAHADPAADAALARYLAPAQPESIRLGAVSALHRHSGPNTLQTLRQAIANDPDPRVKRRAVSALESMPEGEGVPLLIELAKATRADEVRKQAMTSLTHSRDPRALTFFEEVLKK
jgi:hypothetical protein